MKVAFKNKFVQFDNSMKYNNNEFSYYYGSINDCYEKHGSGIE